MAYPFILISWRFRGGRFVGIKHEEHVINWATQPGWLSRPQHSHYQATGIHSTGDTHFAAQSFQLAMHSAMRLKEQQQWIQYCLALGSRKIAMN